MARSTIRWAPKISREAIARFYHEELTGKIDLKAAEEVAIRFYLRCQAMKMYSAGELQCPDCGTVFRFQPEGNKPESRGGCPNCAWYATNQEYTNSRRHKDLNATNAMPAVEHFLRIYPGCKTTGQLLIAVDQLIHAFHWDSQLSVPNRSFANNLIEGSLEQVVTFLDALSSVDTNLKTQWRQTVDQMWQRRRSKAEAGPAPNAPTGGSLKTSNKSQISTGIHPPLPGSRG
ncbi:MAG: hypothetical protein NTV93_18745 [Verrucomicrobia bacterium]|nr:hypothetical protein [Verrucomicrobiota bacterium]